MQIEKKNFSIYNVDLFLQSIANVNFRKSVDSLDLRDTRMTSLKAAIKVNFEICAKYKMNLPFDMLGELYEYLIAGNNCVTDNSEFPFKTCHGQAFAKIKYNTQ